MRFFNTAGPVNCDDHYCLDPLTRFNLEEILYLIEQQKYFVLHAPRQTGKTSCLLALMKRLNSEGRFACVYVNVEMAQTARENVGEGMQTILSTLGSEARSQPGDPFPDEHWPNILQRSGEHAALNQVLTLWASHSERPIVLFMDEIDSLVGDTLISVLRQLRAGYHKRPREFPQSVILCGVRNVQDYRIHSSREKAVITGGSAFNVKAKSLRLGDFNREEMERLYYEHTRETGQIFAPDALDLAWELTRGQPWLVNALAYETCFEIKAGRDRSSSVTAERIGEAKENLIERRETHLDQLADKLQEERVRRVIEAVLAGDTGPELLPRDDIEYVGDLGLIRRDARQLEISNRIYQEVIPRELTYSTQLTISQEPAWYLLPDGRLDMEKLMAAFQEFFREHSEHWVERFQYKEAGPQLLLQAFLQRIVNGGGRIEREYGLGRMRTDLLVVWPIMDGEGKRTGVQKVVIELKILHKSLERTLDQGLRQTWEYMQRCGLSDGHLVIFDRTPDKPWEEKIFRRDEAYRESHIAVWGM